MVPMNLSLAIIGINLLIGLGIWFKPNPIDRDK